MIQTDSKRILLISTLFFDYYKEIKKEAEGLGYLVDFVCDAPSNSNISKAIGRVNKKFIEGSTRQYFNKKVLPLVENKSYDYVLAIASMSFALTPDMIKKLRELNPNAKFVMYQWDGEDNLPFATKIHCFFDKVYTFDRFDCEKREIYTFLPLFYTKEYMANSNDDCKQKYDCAYIGTAHPKKYAEINRMSKALTDALPNQYIYHYMPSRLKYIYHKLLNKEYRKAKFSDFETEKVSKSEIIKLYNSAKCILDAPQAGQNGLTMRTIECLGLKKKLITTNSDIKNYDFYDESNILVYDENLDLDSPFFKNEYKELPETIYRKYSLENWLKTLLEN